MEFHKSTIGCRYVALERVEDCNFPQLGRNFDG